MRGRVLFSLSHGEDVPDRYVSRLEEKGYDIVFTERPIKGISADEYSCVALVNPKNGIDEEEARFLGELNRKGTGVFTSLDFPGEDYRRCFVDEDYLLDELFDSEVLGFDKDILVYSGKLTYEDKKISLFPLIELLKGVETPVEVDESVWIWVDEDKSILETIPKSSFSPDKIRIKENRDYILSLDSKRGFGNETRAIVKRKIDIDIYKELKSYREKYMVEWDKWYEIDKKDFSMLYNLAFGRLKERMYVGFIGDMRKGRSVLLSTYRFFEAVERERNLDCERYLDSIFNWLNSKRRMELKEPIVVKVERKRIVPKEKIGMEKYLNEVRSCLEGFTSVGELLPKVRTLAGALIGDYGDTELGVSLAKLAEEIDKAVPSYRSLVERDYVTYKQALIRILYKVEERIKWYKERVG